MISNQSPKKLRIIIAGGGTGGHIFPAIAVAQAIQKLYSDTDILFVGAKGKMEMEKVPQAGYTIEGLTIAGWNRSSIFKNSSLPWKLLKSFFQVRSIFNKFKPNVVFGVGGYSSFPVLKFAQSKRIPTFIHESNSFAGKSNQWLSKEAIKIFTGTKGMEPFFPSNKIIVTGNPVRQNITKSVFTKPMALSYFGLANDKKTVLIMGGSLGAASINEAIEKNLVSFFEHQIQLIWQTGKKNIAHYTQAAIGYENVYVNSFIDDMSAAYTAADLVVSRSGAMAVSEIALTGNAAIFVPYPHAAEDHQTFNAQTLASEGAAIIVKDKEVNQYLVPELIDLLHHEFALNEMKDKVKQFALPDADLLIASTIIQYFQSIK